MGNDSWPKGRTANGPQPGLAQPKCSEGGWQFARDYGSDRDALARKVEQSLILVGNLTRTQQDILNLIVAGHDAASIADTTGLSLAVVQAEKRSLFAKLGAQSTTDAIRIGIYAQLQG